MRHAAVGAFEDLLGTIPRLVGRTRSQAELAGTLMSLARGGRLRRPAATSSGAPEHERVDVLSVLGDEAAIADPEPPAEPIRESVRAESPAPTADPAPSTADEGDAPLEADLPIQDYDSLAASQVVPRLSTLDPAQLRSVQRYESGHRKRQTILNRVAQLLAT